MKTIDLRLMLAILALALNTPSLDAQTFTLLHTFANAFPHQDSPDGGLALSGGTLYGTTQFGPSPGLGAVFAVNIDGAAFRTLHTFTGSASDGSVPEAGLTLSGGTLYGTTLNGGAHGFGTVFSLDTNGNNFTVVHSFPAEVSKTNLDGLQPQADLLLSGGTLYGTTFAGGAGGSGTVFAVNTNGSGFRVLHQFAPSTGGLTNLDGMESTAGLLLSGDTLYGTAGAGGPHHWGTVFSVNTNGSSFNLLHAFGAAQDANGNSLDGGGPVGGLALSGGVLYGTTSQGGPFYGTVFSLKTDGSDFKLLYSFGTLSTNDEPGDGSMPNGFLVLSGGTLYGTANGGGSAPNPGRGTVYSLNTDGSGFSVLHAFSALSSSITNPDGAYPPSEVVLSAGALYGTATGGGAKGGGTVFSLTVPAAVSLPQLAFVPPAPGSASLTISWPDTATGFMLESNADLGSASSWHSFSGPITDTNGQQTAQISAGPGNSFFRLRHP
jgi:uncharacterized repeat protein (TIGR03803 family)